MIRSTIKPMAMLVLFCFTAPALALPFTHKYHWT